MVSGLAKYKKKLMQGKIKRKKIHTKSLIYKKEFLRLKNPPSQ